MIIMTIRCGSIPRWPQESYSVMLASTGGEQKRDWGGRLRCLLANINRMEVPLYREEPRPPRDGGDNAFIISPTHML